MSQHTTVIAQRRRELRNTSPDPKAWGVVAVAAKVGCDRTTWHRWERGDLTPRRWHRRKIERALGLERGALDPVVVRVTGHITANGHNGHTAYNALTDTATVAVVDQQEQRRMKLAVDAVLISMDNLLGDVCEELVAAKARGRQGRYEEAAVNIRRAESMLADKMVPALHELAARVTRRANRKERAQA